MFLKIRKLHKEKLLQEIIDKLKEDSFFTNVLSLCKIEIFTENLFYKGMVIFDQRHFFIRLKYDVNDRDFKMILLHELGHCIDRIAGLNDYYSTSENSKLNLVINEGINAKVDDSSLFEFFADVYANYKMRTKDCYNLPFSLIEIRNIETIARQNFDIFKKNFC